MFDKFASMVEGQYAFIYDKASHSFYWSGQACRFFDIPEQEMEPEAALRFWSDRTDSNVAEAFSSEFKQILTGEKTGMEFQLRLRDHKGVMRTCTVTLKAAYDEECSRDIIFGMVVDHENTTGIDPVTGLPGNIALQAQMKYMAVRKQPYYLMMIGLRDFFSVNSTYGYNMGNLYLKQIADYGLQLMGSLGYFYRADGCKFVFLMPADQGDMKTMEQLYNTFRNHLKLGVKYGDYRISIDICGGAILSDDDAVGINTIYTSLQYVLAKAKYDHLTELCIFHKEALVKNNMQLHALDKIRASVLDGCKGFYLVYQPIMSADRELVTGVEALIRWHDEEFGEVSPGLFISWLEKDPVFYELGNWILKNAMHDIRDLVMTDPSFILNINLAYSQLQRPEFNTALLRIMKEEHFPPQNLCLELTERCRFLDIGSLQHIIRFWKKIGIKTALDDFGTGYSALSLIFQLPVDQIKIDKSFIEEIEFDRSKQILLKAILDCTDELGVQVCIEGIETERVRDYVRDCFRPAKFQGFFFSRPIGLQDAEIWIGQHRVS